MAGNFITRAGDTWDVIAKEAYDDESCVSLLMENNKKLIDYFVFPAGITVTLPDKPASEDRLPEWRE